MSKQQGSNGEEVMWLLEIFAEQSDQARFITVMLAAVLGYLGIWYTQRRADKRDNRSLQMEKIEHCIKLLKEAKPKILQSVPQKTISKPAFGVRPSATKPKPMLNTDEMMEGLQDLEEVHLLLELHFPPNKIRDSFIARYFAGPFIKNEDSRFALEQLAHTEEITNKHIEVAKNKLPTGEAQLNFTREVGYLLTAIRHNLNDVGRKI